MAIVEKPLFSDEALGKLKSSVTFFKRVANTLYTDPNPGEWYFFIPMLSSPQNPSFVSEAQKTKFQNAVIAWRAFSTEEKAYWNEIATICQTGFNAFLSYFLTEEELEDIMIIGGILPYGGPSAPAGYLLCNGAAVSRSTYAALFAIIGIAYGVGDGSTTFNLPDLRQRFPLGKASSGTGSTLGGVDGNIDHFHTDSGHSHTLFSGSEISAGDSPVYASYTDSQFSATDSKNPPFQVVNFVIKF